MQWSLRVFIALTLLAGIGPVPALAQRPKLDDHLQRSLADKSGSNSLSVIVKIRPDRLGGADKILRRGKVRTEHPSVESFAVDIGRQDLAALAADPAVEHVSIDAPVSAYGRDGRETTRSRRTATSRRSTEPTVGTSALVSNALRATLGVSGLPYTGSGIGVAIIDSGIQPMADFDVRITAFRDFTLDDSPDGRAVAPYDDFGHGTHIAGLIGSNGGMSNGAYRGVAPRARLIGLKVLNSKGHGTTSDVIAALEFATRNKAALGIDVVNLSLGHPIYESANTDPLVQAVEKAVRAGLVVIAAAGNFGENPETGEVGYAGIMSPGNAPSAITVGAVRTKGTADRDDDKVPDYSSRGPAWYDGFMKPDVVAPGDSIISNVSRNAYLAKRYPQLVTRYDSASFLRLSGTSMSAGVTSGVVALVLEAQRYGALRRVSTNPFHWPQIYQTIPRISANTVKALLQFSALTVENGGVAYDALTQGAGAINGEGATRLAYALDARAAVGTTWVGDFGQPVTTIGGVQIDWSQTVYWGGQAVLGPSIVVRELAWDEHVVWGTNTFWTTLGDLEHIVWGTTVQWILSGLDEHIVWGTGLPFDYSYLSDEHVVWGTNLLWDEHVVWGTGLLGLNLDEHVVWGNLFEDLEHVVWGTKVTAKELK